MKRLAPVLVLFVISPLIAEYLSGSMSMGQLWILPFMMPFYGGAAILIREIARRTKRGWGTMAVLALAYGLFEEGITTQSLFNPQYRGLHLLGYGFVPALSTGLPWAVYVVGIHVLWSILAPIALTEALFSHRGDKPWMGRIGFWIVAMLFAADAGMQTYQGAASEHFMATAWQLGTIAALAAILVAAAFFVPKIAPAGHLPPWALALGAFVAGSAFVLFYGRGPTLLAWPVSVAGMLATLAVLVALCRFAGGRCGVFAMAAGTLCVYLWSGFSTEIALYGPAHIQAHGVLAVAVAGLMGLAYWRISAAATAEA